MAAGCDAGGLELRHDFWLPVQYCTLASDEDFGFGSSGVRVRVRGYVRHTHYYIHSGRCTQAVWVAEHVQRGSLRKRLASGEAQVRV